MDNKDLVLEFRGETEATLSEAKEVINEIATGEELQKARDYGIDEIKHLLELYRNPTLWKRLSVLLNDSAQWWPLRRAATILGVSSEALRRFLNENTDKKDPYRKWKASDAGHQDMVAASRYVIKEMDYPHIPGEEESW